MAQNSGQQSSGRINCKTVSDYLTLLQYHHSAMDSRRKIETRVFTGTVIFFLVIAKGATDAISHVSDPEQFKLLMQVIYIVSSVLFVIFILWVERPAKSNREMYVALEKHIASFFKEEKSGPLSVEKEKYFRPIWKLWLVFGSIMTVLGLAGGGVEFISYLKPDAC